MKITILGAAGFIGTNLAINLSKNNDVTVVDKKFEYFSTLKKIGLPIDYKCADFTTDFDYNSLLSDTDIVYHLVSSTVPTTSNQHISEELVSNVVVTSKILEACVQQKVKKVVFMSSGGTVYGKNVECPIPENSSTDPINSYGVQKLTIEKLLYLYNYLYGLDYRIIRLANPYGPYQRPNGVLGVVTTFTYKALKDEEITVYGDGSVIRDFIYIDDAIRGIINITNYSGNEKIFNLGSGNGTSVKEVIETIEHVLNKTVKVKYIDGRKADVPVNYLDVTRYENACGKLNSIGLIDGIKKTVDFMEENYE